MILLQAPPCLARSECRKHAPNPSCLLFRAQAQSISVSHSKSSMTSLRVVHSIRVLQQAHHKFWASASSNASTAAQHSRLIGRMCSSRPETLLQTGTATSQAAIPQMIVCHSRNNLGIACQAGQVTLKYPKLQGQLLVPAERLAP